MKPLVEINAAIHDGHTPPVACIYAFLEHVQGGNFDELFGRLDAKLQRHIVDLTK